jgi:hypothetical protein
MRWAKPSRLMRPYIERLLEMAEQTASLAASILLIASHDPAAPRSKPLLGRGGTARPELWRSSSRISGIDQRIIDKSFIRQGR